MTIGMLVIGLAVVGGAIVILGLLAYGSQSGPGAKTKAMDDAQLLSQLTQKIAEVEKAYVELARKDKTVLQELEAAKQKVTQLEAALASEQDKESKEEGEAAKLKDEIASLKEKIGNKEQGLERASQLNAELTKELKQKEERVQVLEGHNGELAEEVKGLHLRLDEEKAKLATAAAAAAAAAAAVPAIDPAVVDGLKAKVQALTDELNRAKQDMEASRREAVAAREAAAQQASKPQGVPEEEYMKIKDKLEAAEKILRIIHGAG